MSNVRLRGTYQLNCPEFVSINQDGGHSVYMLLEGLWGLHKEFSCHLIHRKWIQIDNSTIRPKTVSLWSVGAKLDEHMYDHDALVESMLSSATEMDALDKNPIPHIISSISLSLNTWFEPWVQQNHSQWTRWSGKKNPFFGSVSSSAVFSACRKASTL